MKLGSNLLALILVLSSIVMISLAFQKKNVEGIDPPTLFDTDHDIVNKLDVMIKANEDMYQNGQVFRNIVTELNNIKAKVKDTTGYPMLVAFYNSAKLNKNYTVTEFADKQLKPIIDRADAYLAPVITPTVTNTTAPVITPTVTNTTAPVITPTVTNTTAPVITPTVTNTTAPVITPTVTNTTAPVITPTVTNTTAPIANTTSTDTKTNKTGPSTITCKNEVWSIAQPDAYPAPNGYTPWVSTISGKPGKYKLLPTNQPYNCNDGGKVLPKNTSPLKFMAVNTLDVTKNGLLSSNAVETGTPGLKPFIDKQLTAAYANIYNR